jgi:ribosomal protein S1
MNFAKFYYNSNSSIHSLQGNVLKSTVEQIHQDKVIINTGLKTPFLCFQHELSKHLDIDKWNHFLSNSVVDFSKLENDELNQKTFFDSYYYKKMSSYSRLQNLDIKNESLETVKSRGSILSKKNVQTQLNFCLIGVEENRSKISGEFVCSSPKSALLLTKRKFIWTELSKLYLSNKKNRINGLILNPVNGGFAVAIAGYIAFLPRSLRINKKVFVGQWRQFSIISMNSKIANIVIKEIKTDTFSETEKKRRESNTLSGPKFQKYSKFRINDRGRKNFLPNSTVPNVTLTPRPRGGRSFH